jgi:hypothetical protein
MAETQFNAIDCLSDEQLKKIGYTKETFKGSNLEAFIEAMLFGIEKAIKDETQKLMKEHSLSYGEAREIATERVLTSFKRGIEK